MNDSWVTVEEFLEKEIEKRDVKIIRLQAEIGRLRKKIKELEDALSEIPDCDNCDERKGEPMYNEGYY